MPAGCCGDAALATLKDFRNAMADACVCPAAPQALVMDLEGWATSSMHLRVVPQLTPACLHCSIDWDLTPRPLQMQALVTEFEGWASVDKNPDMQFDWDDLAGDAKRREAVSPASLSDGLG